MVPSMRAALHQSQGAHGWHQERRAVSLSKSKAQKVLFQWESTCLGSGDRQPNVLTYAYKDSGKSMYVQKNKTAPPTLNYA